MVATGAYAFAWATGLLTFVVPAGVGVREGAMILALSPLIGTGPATRWRWCRGWCSPWPT